MKMGNIAIDRLKIRIKGIPLEIARASVEGLGYELLQQLAKEPGILKEKRPLIIKQIETGSRRAAGNENSTEIRRMFVKSIVKSIALKTK